MVRSLINFSFLLVLVPILGVGCATFLHGEPTSQTVLAEAFAKRIARDKTFKVTPEMIRGVVGVHNTEEHRINAPLGSEIVIDRSAYGYRGSSFSYRDSFERGKRIAQAMR